LFCWCLGGGPAAPPEEEEEEEEEGAPHPPKKKGKRATSKVGNGKERLQHSVDDFSELSEGSSSRSTVLAQFQLSAPHDYHDLEVSGFFPAGPWLAPSSP